MSIQRYLLLAALLRHVGLMDLETVVRDLEGLLAKRRAVDPPS